MTQPEVRYVTDIRARRKSLLVGAIIFGAASLNCLRYIKTAPLWVVLLGVGISLISCVALLRMYISSKTVY
jgi:hypothetical protein